MKKLIIFIMTIIASSTLVAQGDSSNQLLKPVFETPWQTPPFDQIKTADFPAAFDRAIECSAAEVAAIANNATTPTFANTIESLERQGALIDRTATIFFALKSAQTSEAMDQVAQEVIPKLTELSNDISLNEKLFGRIKTVYETRLQLALTTEQSMLLDRCYKGFVRSGAGLSQADKESYRRLTGELSMLSLSFGQNVLAATNSYVLNVPPTDSARLRTMPDFVMEEMAQTAADNNQTGWSVSLHGPSYISFMTYCTDRELKKELWVAYGSRCYGDGPGDNNAIVKQMTKLRMEVAQLLGYKSYADYVLEENMAQSVVNVDKLLKDLLSATRAFADQDFKMISDYAAQKDGITDLKPWDWGYYEEKYRAQKYDLNQEEIKPYFKLENAQNGIFLLANRLYSITFRENSAIPVYHPDVKAFEVYDGDGTFLAILYMDYFPRSSKSGGAWMTSFRAMSTEPDGTVVRPLVSVCCNFTKPTATAPSLLTFDEVSTLLHEFGHALHGIFAQGNYASLTGTSVYQDFVELPSQIMENWATEKEFLDLWAIHYQTGEPMPAELIAKVVAAKYYLEPYRNVRQLSFGMNDMSWHSITAPVEGDIKKFEDSAMEGTQFFQPNPATSLSAAFTHIFAGGYAAGYYSYKWAEVLEADAFSLFRQKGIFNAEVAAAFRREILSKGGTQEPMELYIRFRGHKPEVQALIDKIIPPSTTK